jgi:hypothetical protein
MGFQYEDADKGKYVGNFPLINSKEPNRKSTTNQKYVHTEYSTHTLGRATAQAVSRRLPRAAARVRARFRSCNFLVDKLALGKVFPR